MLDRISGQQKTWRFFFMFVFLRPPAQVHAMLSLPRFLLFSGRFHEREFHKSEKWCLFFPLFTFVLSHVYTTGRVCSTLLGEERRLSIQLHGHWRTCFFLDYQQVEPSALHVPTCTHKCNQSLEGRISKLQMRKSEHVQTRCVGVQIRV